LSVLAWALSLVIPCYRRELVVEDAARLTPLDGLRGVLCFAVFYCHAAITFAYLGDGRWEPTSSAFYTLLGSVSVGLFFCVTAFLFWSRALALGGEIQPYPFLRARLFRIAPLYVFSCLLVLAIAAPRVNWLSLSAVKGLTKMGMLGFHSQGELGGIDISIINARVTWTLQFEWGFYLALLGLALLARDRPESRLAWTGLALIVMFGSGPHLLFRVLPARLPESFCRIC
jgi:peptidoglycan/LPS O-acetylase OafA/YrhL